MRRAPESVLFGDREAPDWIVSVASLLLTFKTPSSSGLLSEGMTLASVSGVIGWEARFGHENLVELDAEELCKTTFMFYTGIGMNGVTISCNPSLSTLSKGVTRRCHGRKWICMSHRMDRILTDGGSG